MMTNIAFPAAQWLQLSALPEKGLFRHTFDQRHIGNTFIRSIHGGVTAGITEICAEMAVKQELGEDVPCEVSSNSMNYLRVTKDHDIHARAKIIRISRRLAFVDVICWQDDESVPVTHGQCTLRIHRREG